MAEKETRQHGGGFTLVELLVVIAIIGILAALIFPVLASAKARTRRVACQNNLHQINLGIRMYADDANDSSPSPGASAAKTNMVALFMGYKQLMKSYLGLKGGSSAQDKMFACPADTYFPNFFIQGTGPAHYIRSSLHDEQRFDYSSYLLSGGDNVVHTHGTTNQFTTSILGLTGTRLGAVQHPTRTVLIAEAGAYCPFSWHDPRHVDEKIDPLTYNDSMDMVSFVDGHVNYVKIYWSSARYPNGAYSLAVEYNPPSGYDYQWSAD